MNKPVKDAQVNTNLSNNEKVGKQCFVIMPISEVDGYDNDHFLRVYNNIIKPACNNSGFLAHRADDVKASNFIQLDILK